MSRQLFGTDGIRGIANVHPIVPELLVKLGRAIALYFKNKNHGQRHKIIIGKDTRISGYMIEYALTSGITSLGVDVLLVGPMPTPAIAHLTRSFNCDAGIVISASHNPTADNGIKIFDENGFKLSDNVEEEIEKIVFSEIKTDNITGEHIGKAQRIDDAKGRYIEFAKDGINDMKIDGIRLVLDCANGAAYAVSPQIFSELGAEIVVLNNKPNGLNINLNSGALHPEIIQKAVVKNKAHIGIALDGDADRVIFCDEKGNIVDGDHIMAIIAFHFSAKKKLKNNVIVATEYSNLGFDAALQSKGIKVIRAKNGDRYVIEQMLANNANLGGEQTGHIILSEQNSTGDGTATALQLLAIMKETGKPLSELAQCMTTFPQLIVNVNVKEKRDFEQMPNVKRKIQEVEQKLKGSGRTLIRYSGTQNVCRIMLEGRNKEEIEIFANEIADEIRKEIGA